MFVLLDEAASEQRSDVIEQNNFAVSQIETGYYDDAIRSLEGALKTCREFVERGGLPEDTFLTTGSSPCMASPDRHMIMSREPIRIPLTVKSNSRTHVMISAMIISNIALSYYFQYERSSWQQQRLLNQSVRYYEMALQLIELTAECEQLEEGMYVVATAA
jgi:tetratricopeptide (TPR) repeat protein